MSVSLFIFIAACLSLITWGLMKADRVYQYPFFMGAIFSAFFIPQSIALTRFPGSAPPQSIERILIYGALCVIMCWFGYSLKPHWLSERQNYYMLSSRRLIRSSVALIIFGNVCLLAIGTILPIPTGSQWSGPATIAVFFSQTATIGSSILLICGLKQRNLTYLAISVFGLFPGAIRVIEAGRRTGTASLFIIVALSVYFAYRILPPRWLSLAMVLLIAALIPLFASIRGGFWEQLLDGNLRFSDLQTALLDLVQTEGKTLELRNAALLAEATQQTGNLGYGTGFWNRIVSQYIPGQLLGYGFKESLYIRIASGRESLQELFGYTLPTGSTLTGLGDSFREFSYLGCFLFAAIGWWFKHLWVSSVQRNSLPSQILYLSLFTPALIGVTHGLGRFLQDSIFVVLVTLIAVRYARIKVRPNTYILEPPPTLKS